MVEEDRARDVEALFVVIFDGVAFMAVDVGALAQQERELKIGRYVGYVDCSHCLSKDVVHREAGKDVVGYMPELAIQQALEAGSVAYRDVGGHARDIFNRRHG